MLNTIQGKGTHGIPLVFDLRFNHKDCYSVEESRVVLLYSPVKLFVLVALACCPNSLLHLVSVLALLLICGLLF